MLPDMELHAARVLLLEGVAVDALGILLRAVYHIAVNDLFLIVRKAALADGQVFVGDIGGGDEAVGQVRIYLVSRYPDAEGLLSLPTVFFLYINLHVDCGRCVSELFPLFLAWTDVLTLECADDVPRTELRNELLRLFLDPETERCDIPGYGYVGIVGVNVSC
jgi:hypothetical protein